MMVSRLRNLKRFYNQGLLKKTLISILTISWIFSGWPPVWQNSLFPPEIQTANAAPTFTSRGTQFAQGSSLTGAFDFTVNKPTGTVDGDIMFMFLSIYIATPPTVDSVPSGWQVLATNTTGNNRWYLYYKIASSEGSNYTWSLSASCRYLATNIAYEFGSFDVQSISDITPISNTLYGTGSTAVRAATMSVSTINSPLVFFGGIYNTTVRTFTKPSTPTADWVEDYDYGHTTPDLSQTIDSMIWSGSGATSDIDATCSTSITTNKHAFAVALKPLPLPNAPVLYPDDGGSNQIAFNNTRQNDATPIVRASATHTASFDRFQVEFNTASNFGGTAYTETFSGTYSSGTTYNLQTTATLDLPTTDGATYYVRARASANGGSNYGDWSSGVWSYTYKNSGDPEWFQTADAQFATGGLTDTTPSGGSVGLSSAISATGGTTSDSGGYRRHVFTSGGTFQVTSGSGNIEVLVVAGGGGAGQSGSSGGGGAGGAGGLLFDDSFSVSSGSYTVTVGGGGAGGTAEGANGSNSVFDSLVAIGGGGGANGTNTPNDGSAGGSGGGARGYEVGYGGAGTAGQGNDGGDSLNSGTGSPAGGGGGAGSAGGDSSSSVAGNGGSGLDYSSYFGTDVGASGWFAGGGGGGSGTGASSGGTASAGGGAGGGPSTAGSNATANTGGGGGGGGSNNTNGGDGGSGVVIIRYSLEAASSGTIMSPEVDFDWVPGQSSWDEAAFSTTETNGDVKLKVYYTSSTACDTIVPDGALSGNSSGFDVSASPINISGLNTTTYNKICLLATLTNSGGTPYLNDWTVSSGSSSPPNAPTLYPDDGGSNQIAFNNTRQNDATPIVRASATHTASFDRFQVEFNTASGFGGTAYTETFSGTYSSGTAYNLQTTGSLSLPTTDGVTYYVRARASADGGSSYGDWSSGTWSYTYKSSGNADWFQTTDAQFSTGTLSNVTTSGSGSVMTTGIDKVGTDTSTTEAGAVNSISWNHTLVAGSNRMVMVSYGIENEGDITVSSITYGGQNLTQGDYATHTTQYVYRTEVWYILEDDLPSDGSNQVVINFATTTWSVSEINAFAAEYAGVHQSAPEETDSYSEDTPSDDTIENSISPSAGAWVISAVGCGTNASGYFEHGQSQDEVLDFDDSSSQFAVAELRGATGSETSLSSTYYTTANRLSRVAVSFAPVSSVARTIMSPEIDYDWVPSQSSWGTAAFSTTETNGDVKLKVYYTSSTACDTIVPDGALSGNSSGFDVSASPKNISGLNTTTYNKICLQATLAYSGGTPYLNDWTVSWSTGGFLETIDVRAQNYTTSISSITFPQGAPGSDVTQPYNNIDTASSPQSFGGAGVAKPVVTLYNGGGTTLTIWYNISTFTNGIVSSENYLINTKGAACADASAITGSVTFDADTATAATIAAGAGNEKDLYLKTTLSGLAAVSGSSTLTILGET